MKTKLLLLLFASFALPAAAWHVADNGDLVEDFENAEDDLDNGIHKYSFQAGNLKTTSTAPLPTLKIETDGENHYLYGQLGSGGYSNEQYGQLAIVNVTLPGGKSLQDFKAFRVNFKDLSGGTWAQSKLLLTYAKKAEDSDFCEIQRSNQSGQSLTENPYTFPIVNGYVQSGSGLKAINPRNIYGDVNLGFRVNDNSVNNKFGIDNLTLVSNQPQTTGVDEVAVSSDEGFEIDGAGILCDAPTSVYTISGALVASGEGRIELRPGCYVAVCGGKATKFVIL